MERISFSTHLDRSNRIKRELETGKYEDRSTLINAAIDFYFKDKDSNTVIDFFYFIVTPLILFLACVGITLVTADLFFYVVSGLCGLYVMIFSYLFYDKHKDVVKRRKQ